MDKDSFPDSFNFNSSKSFYASVISSSWLMLLAAVFFMGLSWYVLEEYLRDRGEERFNNNVQDLISAVSSRMTAYEQVLRGGVQVRVVGGGTGAASGRTESVWQKSVWHRSHPRILARTLRS